mgnify:CR=1 FL=1
MLRICVLVDSLSFNAQCCLLNKEVHSGASILRFFSHFSSFSCFFFLFATLASSSKRLMSSFFG